MATQLAELEVDLVTRGHLEKGLVSLKDEFAGVFGAETIERYMTEAIGDLPTANVQNFVPLFAHRFARERLRALGQADEKITKDVPEILFVCVHNAGRSQMAAGLLNKLAAGHVHVRTAGSDPSDEINAAAVAKALGDPARMQLVDVLRKHAGKVCVCELVPLFDVSQPTLSHHLKKLREAGIVDSERKGLWAYYFVLPEALEELTSWLS